MNTALKISYLFINMIFDRKLLPLHYSSLEMPTLTNTLWLEESIANLIKTFSIKSETDRDTVQSLILHGIHSSKKPCFTSHRGPLA